MSTRSRMDASSSVDSLSPAVPSNTGSGPGRGRGLPGKLQDFEEDIEKKFVRARLREVRNPKQQRRLLSPLTQGQAWVGKAIYRCRFLAIFAVWGSLVGSFLCFIKGCTYVLESFRQYFLTRGKVIFLLVEAIDVYLLGTVMLVFGMGLYELFISTLDIAKLQLEENFPYRSSLFGLFTLKERPKWLEIKTINALKTKLGHVIVMLLLIGLFDKSKKAAINTPVDLLCFSASVLLSSGCLYLLSKLNGSN